MCCNIMPLESFYNKNHSFIEWKMYFCTLHRGSNIKKLLIDMILSWKKNSSDIFRVAPFKLMLGLSKDALFNSKEISKIK